MKIEITRSFSKKIQLKQFEPVDVFCSAKVSDIEILGDLVNGEVSPFMREITKEVSENLDKFVQDEVGKTLEKLRPSLIKESGQDKLKVADVSVDEAENDE